MSDDIERREIQVTTADACVLRGDVALPLAPIASASILHPHPRMGGDRHNGVVEALFRALPLHRIAAVRIDFRGVGRSTGTYGGGVGERHDAVAALEAASDAVPGVPVWSVGYSFGGDVALSVDRPDLAGWVAVAPPLAVLPESPPAAEAGRPAVLVVPAHDQFNPPDAARTATAHWPDTQIVEISMADHFLVGRLDAVVEMVVGAITPAGH
jgi:uncharacterized protein